MTYFMKAQSAKETHLAATDNSTARETRHFPLSAAFNSKINDCVISSFNVSETDNARVCFKCYSERCAFIGD